MWTDLILFLTERPSVSLKIEHIKPKNKLTVVCFFFNCLNQQNSATWNFKKEREFSGKQTDNKDNFSFLIESQFHWKPFQTSWQTHFFYQQTKRNRQILSIPWFYLKKSITFFLSFISDKKSKNCGIIRIVWSFSLLWWKKWILYVVKWEP